MVAAVASMAVAAVSTAAVVDSTAVEATAGFTVAQRTAVVIAVSTGFHSVSHGPVYGGYRGAGFYGGRGYGWGLWRWTRLGLPGWRGGWGGWGYPGFGWGGWGIGLSFNFGFGGWGPWYPSYAYNPWWWAPPAAPPCYYAAPCYAPSGYSQADPNSYDPGSYNPGSYNIDSQDYQENQNNYPTGYSNTDYSNPESTHYVGPTSQQLAESAVRQIPNARPEVRNAIRALSGMPPAARERELATGLYASFSPEERQVVRAAVFTPAINTNARTIERAAVRAPAQHRREVQNAIRTLQAMPPAARERQINSGVYSSFSPSERQMLKTVAQVQTGM